VKVPLEVVVRVTAYPCPEVYLPQTMISSLNSGEVRWCDVDRESIGWGNAACFQFLVLKCRTTLTPDYTLRCLRYGSIVL
jgi:hypothetical protein